MTAIFLCYWWLDGWTKDDTLLSICAGMTTAFIYLTTGDVVWALVAGVIVVVLIFVAWLVMMFLDL